MDLVPTGRLGHGLKQNVDVWGYQSGRLINWDDNANDKLTMIMDD